MDYCEEYGNCVLSGLEGDLSFKYAKCRAYPKTEVSSNIGFVRTSRRFILKEEQDYHYCETIRTRDDAGNICSKFVKA